MNEEETNQDQQDQQEDMGGAETAETQQPGGAPRTFRDQPIYQLAFEFQQKVYELTKGFPEEELYALTEPLRLASRKIGAAVAEAWVKRRFQSQYPGKLAEVEAHAAASDHWIGTAEQSGYLTAEVVAELRGYVENIRGNVWRMTPRIHHVHGGGPERGPERRNFRNNDRPRDDRPPRDDDRPPRSNPRNFRGNPEGGGRFYNNRNNRGGGSGYYNNRPAPERELREPGEFRDAEPQY